MWIGDGAGVFFDGADGCMSGGMTGQVRLKLARGSMGGGWKATRASVPALTMVAFLNVVVLVIL